MKKFLEILKNFFGDDLKEEDITKAQELEEEAQTALGDAVTIFADYRDDFPPDVLTAIATVTKAAITPAEKIEEPDFVADLTNVEKAGARLSKATIAQLKKIGEIVSSMLSAAETALKKGTGDDDEELSPELTAKLEKLAAYERAEKELEKQKIADAQKKTDDKIAELTEEIEKLKKKKRTQKSLESDDDDDTGDDDPENKGGDKEEFQWTSLIPAEDQED